MLNGDDTDGFGRVCGRRVSRRGWRRVRSGHVVAIDFIDDVDALLGFDPPVLVGEAGIGADGGDDSVSGGLNVCGAFEEKIEDGAKVLAALGVEAGGTRVAVDGRPVEGVINGEQAADGLRTVPVDEKLLDGFAVGMIADCAFAAVALEAGFGFGIAGIRAHSGGARFGAQNGFGVGGDCGGHGLFLLFLL